MDTTREKKGKDGGRKGGLDGGHREAPVWTGGESKGKDGGKKVWNAGGEGTVEGGVGQKL